MDEVLKLKAEGGLIYQRDGDGWTVVASTLAGPAGMEDEMRELAELLAEAPKLKQQRDELLAACEALVVGMQRPENIADQLSALKLAGEAIKRAREAESDDAR